MAEIKLICPGCGAEYLLPGDALPPAGREVECSHCDHVWHARPTPQDAPLDLASYTLGTAVPDAPPARRPLPASVLDILREEVEHERRLREAEDAPAAPPPQQPPAAEADWPATTVTTAAPPSAEASGPSLPPAQPAPLVIRHQPAPAQTPPPLIASTPEPEPDARGRYGLGFALMVMLAACAVVLYVLAPQLDGQGLWGEALADWRDGIDRARLWLDQQADRLRG